MKQDTALGAARLGLFDSDRIMQEQCMGSHLVEEARRLVGWSYLIANYFTYSLLALPAPVGNDNPLNLKAACH